MISQMHEAYAKIKSLHSTLQGGNLTATASINGIVIMASVDSTNYGRIVRYSMTYGLYGYTTRNSSKAVNALFNALGFVS
jgi:hypothetical protein